MAAYQLLFDLNASKKRVYRHTECNFDADELKQRFRFSINGIRHITDILDPYLRRQTYRNFAISPETQVLLALRFFASGSPLRVVGDTLGYHVSSVSRAVRDVAAALCHVGPTYISWPDNDERKRIREGFYNIAAFPGVMGAIDGTHVRIQAPTVYENTFVNRKGYHSVNVQAVCDHRGKLLNLVAKWPGSCHDSFIFRTSELAGHLERTHRGFDIDGVLLGDSGYACGKYLVTPYLNPDNQSQINYNHAHTRTRAVIERCFGWWKRRFAVLHNEIRMDPERAVNIITACGVLHNIALKLNEPMDDRPLQEEGDLVQPVDNAGQGRHVRDYIANTYFA